MCVPREANSFNGSLYFDLPSYDRTVFHGLSGLVGPV